MIFFICSKSLAGCELLFNSGSVYMVELCVVAFPFPYLYVLFLLIWIMNYLYNDLPRYYSCENIGHNNSANFFR